MELFKFFLFGITGLSTIFWVAVIALWHTYMFPRLFKEDQFEKNYMNLEGKNYNFKLKPSGVSGSKKYLRKSFVIADFNPIEANYAVNRLYTSMLLSVGVMTFLLITFGLHSGLSKFVSL